MAVEYPPLFERKEVGGLKVVKDEVLPSGLSRHYGRLIPIHGIRRLTLEDDTVVLGCRDCEFIAGPDGDGGTGLGQVRQHRSADHGVSMGGHTKRNAAEARDAGATAAPVDLPVNALSMTLHELLELAAHTDMWEQVLTAQQDTITALTEQRDKAVAGQRAAEKELVAHKRRAARALKALGLNEE